MAITTAMSTSFKVEILKGLHDFTASTGDAFKVALIKPSMAGTYGAASTNYSDITGNSDEASGTGYSAGGFALTSVTPVASSTTALCDFSPDATWTTSTFDSAGCMIYNTSNSNSSISVHDFGGTVSVTAGTLTLAFPTADASNAIIRIA